MQSLEMLIMTYRLLTARGVKEVIHGGLHPNNIDKNNGIKIPEAGIPMIPKTQRETGTTANRWGNNLESDLSEN